MNRALDSNLPMTGLQESGHSRIMGRTGHAEDLNSAVQSDDSQ